MASLGRESQARLCNVFPGRRGAREPRDGQEPGCVRGGPGGTDGDGRGGPTQPGLRRGWGLGHSSFTARMRGALGQWPEVRRPCARRQFLHTGGYVRGQPVTPCGGPRHQEGLGRLSLPAAPDVTSGPSQNSATAFFPPTLVTRRPLPAGLPADCRGRWESFVEETLTETNRRNAVDLVRAGRAACGWVSGARALGPSVPPITQGSPGPGVRGSRPPAAVLG